MAFPFERQWEKRERPAHVAAISTTRGFSERVEPRARDRPVEKRRERVSVDVIVAANDVTGVDGNARVARFEDEGARCAADVAPHDARLLGTGAFGAKERPPARTMSCVGAM